MVERSLEGQPNGHTLVKVRQLFNTLTLASVKLYSYPLTVELF